MYVDRISQFSLFSPNIHIIQIELQIIQNSINSFLFRPVKHKPVLLEAIDAISQYHVHTSSAFVSKFLLFIVDLMCCNKKNEMSIQLKLSVDLKFSPLRHWTGSANWIESKIIRRMFLAFSQSICYFVWKRRVQPSPLSNTHCSGIIKTTIANCI